VLAESLYLVKGEEGYGSCGFVDYGAAYHGVRLICNEGVQVCGLSDKGVFVWVHFFIILWIGWLETRIVNFCIRFVV
jgi:hypothetical protein